MDGSQSSGDDATRFIVAPGVVTDNVHPGLMATIQEASRYLPPGYSARMVSGERSGDPRFHGQGMALDIQLVDPDGKPIPNYQSGPAFRAYESFAQTVHQLQPQIAPDAPPIRWGGYFSGPKGKYGAADLMHFDVGLNGQMAGGSWDDGLTPQQRAYFPDAKSVGLKGGQQMAADVPDLLGQWAVPKSAAPPSSAPAAAKAADEVPDLLRAWAAQTKPSASSDTGMDVLREMVAGRAPPPSNSSDAFDRSAPIINQLASAARQTGGYVAGQAAGIPSAISNAFGGATSQAKQGINELASGNYAPSFPSRDPSTWGAGGVVNALAGGAGALFSPVTGAINQLVADPVTQATGSPEIGARAGLVANMAAGPVTAKLAGNALNTILPTARAESQLRNVLGASPAQDVVDRLRANPNLRVIDVNDAAKANALGLATDPAHPAYGILQKSVADTREAAPASATAAYDMAMGETPNVQKLIAGLEEKRQANATAGYGKAFENAAPADISGVVAKLDEKINPQNIKGSLPVSGLPQTTAQAAASDIKSMLTAENGSTITDPTHLHQIQSKLRVAAEAEARRGTLESSIKAAQLNDTRSGVIDALDKVSDGKYSEARLKYREDSSVPEAFEKGTTVYKNGSIEDRPEYWQSWKDHATPEEIEAAKLGMRTAVDKAMNGTRFAARNGQNIPEVPFNLEKMKIILGDKEATALASRLADDKAVATTNALLASGSKTALTTAAQKATAVRDAGLFKGLPPGAVSALLAEHFGAGNLGTLAAGLGGMGANYLGRLSDIGRNTAAARLYAMPGVNALHQVYQPSRGSLPYFAAAPVSGAAGLLNKPINALAAPNAN